MWLEIVLKCRVRFRCDSGRMWCETIENAQDLTRVEMAVGSFYHATLTLDTKPGGQYIDSKI